jgi:hypothetical protein
MRTRFFSVVALAAVALAVVGLSRGQTVTLAWDGSPSAAVAGYRVYWGTNSRAYCCVTNAGLALTQAVVLPHGGRWFFAATAYDTNGLESDFSGEVSWEPVATNLVAAVVTNFVPVFYTNVVQVPVTNLVAKPEAEAAIQAAGSVVNTFAPGIGSILALALGGLYHGYRQVRSRKVNEALIQGVETARAVLTTTPQGQAADAQFVKWLMDHQKEAGVFTTVSGLVEQLTDNPAARMTAQEIAQRVQQAQQQRTVGPGAAVPS